MEADQFDLVLVSMNEKGFPQADLFLETNHDDDLDGAAADQFFTMKRGDTIEAAVAKAKAKWPKARLMIADVCETDNED